MYEDLPERSLLTKVIDQAVQDARDGGKDAYSFLTTSRIDPFLILLDIEPSYFKEKIKKKLERELAIGPAVTRT